MSPQERPPSWTPRSACGLRQDQLAGLSAWREFLHRQLGQLEGAYREEQLDARRRRQALLRADTAVLSRAQDHRQLQRADADVPRAVLVHRHPWLRDKLTRALQELGVLVIAELDDGADGLGLVVAEQPDLVLVEDLLPSVPGTELVRIARPMTTRTIFTAQVAYADDITGMLEAGATAAFARQVPPAHLAEELAALLLPR